MKRSLNTLNLSRSLVLSATLALLPSCAWLAAHRGDLIDCAAPVVASQIGGILANVGAILGGGQPDWGSQLDLLLKSSGPAAACAVDRFAKGSVAIGAGGAISSSGHALSTETRDVGSIAGASEAKARAEAYLKSRGIGIK
jgi:hypothetical protein